MVGHESMRVRHTIPWCSALHMAAALSTDASAAAPWVLLHSSLQTSYSGRYSYLAWEPRQCLQSSDFNTLRAQLSSGRDTFENAWWGYLGYGLRHALERLPAEDASACPTGELPHLWMMRASHLLVWDHALKIVTFYSDAVETCPLTPEPLLPELQDIEVRELSSNMTKAEYLQHIEDTLAQIAAGEFYQANITRKFYGRLRARCDSFALFVGLCAISPSPYGAYIWTGEHAIVSSSPERFITMDHAGHVMCRPIKGSAARGSTDEEDHRMRAQLRRNAKDRAENLMIVDLMRHDLARHCQPGSVQVPELCALDSYATVHHLSSSITAVRREGASTLDVVCGCFPPGSMTGAPKIRAMQWCTQVERSARGVYSGALGWFGGDGTCDLSVVIRTLVLRDTHFEFQVGGGIVAESQPVQEWEETLTKARALCQVLGIPHNRLAGI